MFQLKKICIVESIEFLFIDDDTHFCHASVYVAQWYGGKLCDNFLEKLRTQRVVHFVDDNHCVWKIIPTPTIIQRTTSQKWFQRKVMSAIQSDFPIVKITPKPKSISRDSDLSDVSDEDTDVSDEDSDDVSEYNTDDSDINSLFTEIEFES